MTQKILKFFILITLFSLNLFSNEVYVNYEEAIQNLNDNKDLALPLFTQRASYQSRIDLALQSDNRQLDVLTFSLAEDAVGFSLFAAAIEIVERGGKARIGYDAFSSKISPELFTYMRMKGVDLRAFRPLKFTFKNLLHFLKLGPFGFIKYLNMRTHDKIFITQRGTIVGSSNYSKYYYLLAKKEMPIKKDRWNAWTFLDREILIQGPAEQQARNEFENKWSKNDFWKFSNIVGLTDEKRIKFDFEIAKQNKFINEVKNSKIPTDFIKVQDMEYVADSIDLKIKHQNIHNKILDMINNAKSEIIIENPYVLLPKDIYKALLIAKHERGVRVMIFTNSAGGSDEGDVSKQFKIDLRKLENSGFEVHLNEAFYVYHGKIMLVDREKIFWGSYNFDNRSKEFNSENGVFFRSKEIASMIYDKTVKNGIFRAVNIIGQGKKSYNVVYLPKSCREFYSKSKIEKINLPQGFIEKLIMSIKKPLL